MYVDTVRKQITLKSAVESLSSINGCDGSYYGGTGQFVSYFDE
jgi:hypothetical protein